MRREFLLGVAASVLAAAAACSQSPAPPGPAAAQAADTIYTGGDIVTVNDAQPTAEAVAVKGGKILAVGTREAIEKAHAGQATTRVDLAGRTLVPGLFDSHVHVAQLGTQAVGANLLAAPDGDANTIDDIVRKLKEFASGPDVKRTGWIFGMGYDDSLLGRHPTRDDLDKVSTEVPVIAVHISGHFSAVNSVALKQIGYTAATKDPVGGIIRRRPGSREPLGVNEELAHFAYAFGAVSPKTQADRDYFLTRGLELAKSFGFTTAIEGRAQRANHDALKDAAARGLLDIDVLTYVDHADRAILDTEVSGTYTNRYRAAGLKITLDGSAPGRTAWRTMPYLKPPPGAQADYKAYGAIPDTAELQGLVDEAYRKKWPTHIHANGDAAVDQMIAAVRPAFAKHGPADRRTVMIHGVLMRKDQLQTLKDLQVMPSLFPMHTFYWGDWYEQIVGPEQAQAIAPIGSALRLGMSPTSHSDAPVALPNLMQVMWATVNRVSRSGKVMGPDQRLTPIDALKSITLWSALQNFEDKTKGSIEVGKLADFAILDRNPITVDPMSINKILVVETIKEGKTVYRR
jgi:predicted amidohydrolase YtcJ